jgi:hypothetical protein
MKAIITPDNIKNLEKDQVFVLDAVGNSVEINKGFWDKIHNSKLSFKYPKPRDMRLFLGLETYYKFQEMLKEEYENSKRIR